MPTPAPYACITTPVAPSTTRQPLGKISKATVQASHRLSNRAALAGHAPVVHRAARAWREAVIHRNTHGGQDRPVLASGIDMVLLAMPVVVPEDLPIDLFCRPLVGQGSGLHFQLLKS
jgi:hypothetical protein